MPDITPIHQDPILPQPVRLSGAINDCASRYASSHQQGAYTCINGCYTTDTPVTCWLQGTTGQAPHKEVLCMPAAARSADMLWQLCPCCLCCWLPMLHSADVETCADPLIFLADTAGTVTTECMAQQAQEYMVSGRRNHVAVKGNHRHCPKTPGLCRSHHCKWSVAMDTAGAGESRHAANLCHCV